MGAAGAPKRYPQALLLFTTNQSGRLVVMFEGFGKRSNAHTNLEGGASEHSWSLGRFIQLSGLPVPIYQRTLNIESTGMSVLVRWTSYLLYFIGPATSVRLLRSAMGVGNGIFFGTSLG